MKFLSRLILVIIVLTQFLRAETLTPIGEGNPAQTVPQNAAELWEEFDPTVEPLDTEILYQWQEDGVTLRVVRFRVGIFRGETAMVAGVYGFPTGQSNLPALLNIHGGGQYADYRACLTNAKRGYATLSIAWTGRISATSPNDAGAGYTVAPVNVEAFWTGNTADPNYKITTDWGPLEGYHAPSRFEGSSNVGDLLPANWTYDAVESPRNNTWFLWTMACRRGLTFLELQGEVDGTKLGVYGHSMGGKLTVMTAGSDSRVKAAAPSCGGISDFDKEAFYDATIGDTNYWGGIKCPVMFLKPSNDFHSHIADVPAAVAVLEGNGNDWRVSTSPHHNHQDTSKYSVATQLWMDEHLKSSLVTPSSPVIQVALDTHSGVPLVSITVDNITRPVQSVEVYYTQAGEDAGEEHPFQDFSTRHWHYTAASGSGANWTADVPVHSTDEPLWVFANVTYDTDAPITGAGYYYASYTANEFVLSTPIASITSVQLQTAGVNATLAATTQIEDYQSDWQKEWFEYTEAVDVWQYSTHKINDLVYAAPQYAKLAFEVRSAQANKLVVRIDNAAVEIDLPGGNTWQEVVLFPVDFQTGSGSWAYDWSTGKELEITNYKVLNGGALIVGNFSWNGSAPEFRDLHWMAGTKKEYDSQFENKLLELTPVDGKYYLEIDAADEITEVYPTINGGWFTSTPGEVGDPLVVDGVTYPNGITMHANGEIVYFLGSAFYRFKAFATAGSSPLATIKMQIYLDDVLAFDSGELTAGEFVPVDLDVSDTSVMKLVVIDSGDGINGDHGSWVDGHLTLPPDPEDGTEVIFTENFENYGQPDGAGWTDFDGLFTDSKLGLGVPGTVFSGGGSLLWFDTTTDPIGEFKPYAGATTADDPANIQNTYAAMSDGTNPYPPEGVEITYGGGTGQTFVEGNEYFLKFVYFNRPNLEGIAFTAELYNVETGLAVASGQFAEIGVNTYEFNDGMVSYTATVLDDGAEIGVRFIGTPATANTNQLGLDNITVSTVAEVPPLVVPEEVSDSDEMAYWGDVSGSDLLDGVTASTTGTWMLGSAWRLNDGDHGRTYAAAGNTQEGAWTSVGASATFAIGSGANGTGYDISSILSIASWSGTFANQAWKVEVKSVGGDWVLLDTVDYQPLTIGGATKVTLADPSGTLATGVEAIRFTANSVDGDANGGAFIWREIDVFGTDSGGEAVPPTLVSLSPDTVVDGSIRSNISPKTKLIAKFNEDVALATGDITIVNLDTLVETVISLPSDQVEIDSIDQSLLVIEPDSVLLENARYAVCVDATVIDDLSGNSFAGILDTTTWTFTTRGPNPLNILCIGDSITVGYTDDLTGDPFNFGYRGHLYELLNDAGYVFQYVGGSTQPWDGSFGLDPTIGGTHKPEFDLRDLDQDYQQGGGGASIEDLIIWIDDFEPDLILLKIGINSIQEGVIFETVRDYIYELVETIIIKKPDAHLIVAQTIPYSGDYVSYPVNEGKNLVLRQYNTYIRDQLIADLVSAGKDASKVSTADMYSMFLTDPTNYESAVAIGRHSNYYNHPWNTAVDGAGYDTMAQQWFDAIEALNIGPDSFGFWLNNPAFGIDHSGQGLSDDPDGDNLASGLEAWFGTNPNGFDIIRMENLNADGVTTSFEHPYNPDKPSDLIGTYEWSINLSDWYAGDGVAGPVDGPRVSISANVKGSSAQVSATSNQEMEKVFLRATVSKQN